MRIDALRMLIAAVLCMAAPSADADEASAVKENRPMPVPPAPTRPAPPQVAPVEHDGIRYEQLADGRVLPGSERGGVLAARDVRSGALLWTLRLYEARQDAGAPFQPGRYFATMTLDATGARIVVEDERGERYEVDMERRSFRRLGGAPPLSDATTPL